ncbi:Rieske (2Fe-2S) protein [Calycomorphotria hydatis]|uniref:Ferredoxin CarAc n=1 Tax=Calycomorphotria hydatis TaxID=2528027 RepID=A0A517T5P1_9PLAN|nr:Rieske (2Fe-2S) protein [Calycomorphotria hydatis]QDT63684.1 Ferredoxin CarAc [Calycomorphotria hydatis]
MPAYKLCDVDELPPGKSGEYVAGERVVALFNVDGEFHALDGVCPHAGGPLGKGVLTNKRVTCPWHGWQFDVTTGVSCLTENIVHERFEVEVRDGEVWVEVG